MFRIKLFFIITFYGQSVLAQTPTILVLGDSLSAAYGIAQNEGWVQLLHGKFAGERNFDYKIINASISGDTTNGGLQRLPKALKQHRPHIVIIELGANDGLRGQSLKNMRQNLITMIELSQKAEAKVLLLGMRIPSNYGMLYTQRFHKAFKQVAKKTNASLMPFFLQPISKGQKYFQPDGLHPTASAQPLLLDAVWPHLEPLLE